MSFRCSINFYLNSSVIHRHLISGYIVMFCSFGACQSGGDISARKRGFEAAARLFELADGTVDDDDDPLSEKGDKPEIAGKVTFKNCVFAYPTRPASRHQDLLRKW